MSAKQMDKVKRGNLPPWCAVTNPTTGKPVIITAGEAGFRTVNPDCFLNAEQINALLRVTPEQANAMLAGSMFGWNCPAAACVSLRN